ncbi:three component ABC system middle component [Pedobacter heparinus]|uniref:three component ABC system middle component n=1 Tax=Pedobacter heparinus TaxID=984 RepID=UPI00292F8BB1|nr:three component ABC system middle component [Pedobacter heparinus]
MKLNEFEIFQNKVVGAHAIWEFSKYYQMHHVDKFCPSLICTMPVLPLCLNRRVIENVKERKFKEGSLLKTLDENKDLFSGLQDRMEGMAELTLESIYLGAVTGLFYYDRENSLIIPRMKFLPAKIKDGLNSNKDYSDIIHTSKRVGAWFSQFNHSELLFYFNLQF